MSPNRKMGEWKSRFSSNEHNFWYLITGGIAISQHNRKIIEKHGFINESRRITNLQMSKARRAFPHFFRLFFVSRANITLAKPESTSPLAIFALMSHPNFLWATFVLIFACNVIFIVGFFFLFLYTVHLNSIHIPCLGSSVCSVPLDFAPGWV